LPDFAALVAPTDILNIATAGATISCDDECCARRGFDSPTRLCCGSRARRILMKAKPRLPTHPHGGVESVQIKISARHGHLSEDSQEFIREKAQRLLHYFERIQSIEVTVDLKNDLKTVEILV
jgi:hypothetical protein